MAQPDSPDPVLALVTDLIFGSKISSTGRELGIPVRILRKPELLASEAGRMLMVDLSLAGAIEAAAGWQKRTSCPAIGFVSHVDEKTIEAARSAGLSQVLPRGRFSQLLPELLKSAGE